MQVLICFVPALLFIIIFVWNRQSKNTWFCDKLGWHEEPKDQTVHGINTQGVCPRCGKDVMQDSQGNWF